MYWVYILKCFDKSFYTGVTNNIERRISEHINGTDIKSFTFKRRPLELVYSDYFESVFEALEAEKRIKNWSRAKKEALINGDYESLKLLSKKKFG